MQLVRNVILRSSGAPHCNECWETESGHRCYSAMNTIFRTIVALAFSLGLIPQFTAGQQTGSPVNSDTASDKTLSTSETRSSKMLDSALSASGWMNASGHVISEGASAWTAGKANFRAGAQPSGVWRTGSTLNVSPSAGRSVAPDGDSSLNSLTRSPSPSRDISDTRTKTGPIPLANSASQSRSSGRTPSGSSVGRSSASEKRDSGFENPLFQKRPVRKRAFGERGHLQTGSRRASQATQHSPEERKNGDRHSRKPKQNGDMSPQH
jgi:hypothetical protein